MPEPLCLVPGGEVTVDQVLIPNPPRAADTNGVPLKVENLTITTQTQTSYSSAHHHEDRWDMNVPLSGLISPCTMPLAWQSCKASTREAMIWKTLPLFKVILTLAGSEITVRRLLGTSSMACAREYRCTVSVAGSKAISSLNRLQPRQLSRTL